MGTACRAPARAGGRRSSLDNTPAGPWTLRQAEAADGLPAAPAIRLPAHVLVVLPSRPAAARRFAGTSDPPAHLDSVGGGCHGRETAAQVAQHLKRAVATRRAEDRAA